MTAKSADLDIYGQCRAYVEAYVTKGLERSMTANKTWRANKVQTRDLLVVKPRCASLSYVMYMMSAKTETSHYDREQA